MRKTENKMVNDISLTASMRSNLLSLQNTQSLMDRTQERLSTGKKVNSAIDNPSSYYTARSLTNRASDLSALLDSMGQGIQTIQAANEGIEAVTSFVEQAKALINTARDTSAGTDGGMTVSGDFAATAATKKNVTFDISINGGAAETLTIEDVGNDSTTQDIEQLRANVEAGLKALTAPEAADFTVEVSDDGKSLVIKNADPTVSFTISKKTGGSNTDTINGLTLTGTKPAGGNDRTSAQAQYNEILNQINQLAKDSGYKGVNLLAGGELKVKFNEKGDSSLTITGENASAQGLGLADAEDWAKVETATTQAKTALENAQKTLTTAQNATVAPSGADYTTEEAKQQAIATAQQDVDTKQAAYDALVKTDTAAQKTKIEDSIKLVDAAISTLRTWASDFGNNYSIVQSREDFTENLINVLTEGADKLTLADMNEESANMLALQTRQQLAINSLSLASQAAQSVLQLF